MISKENYFEERSRLMRQGGFSTKPVFISTEIATEMLNWNVKEVIEHTQFKKGIFIQIDDDIDKDGVINKNIYGLDDNDKKNKGLLNLFMKFQFVPITNEVFKMTVIYLTNAEKYIDPLAFNGLILTAITNTTAIVED